MRLTSLVPVLALAFVVVLAGVSGAASLYVDLTERTDRYRLLSDAIAQPAASVSRVTWKPAPRPLVREFTAFDEAKIGTALTEAWVALAVAQEDGHPEILSDHFSGVALARAEVSVQMAQEQGTGMVILSQILAPVLFHLDGSVVQVVGETLAVRFVHGDDGPTFFELSRDQTVTTLLNESSGWRVFSHERRAAEPLRPAPAGYAAEPLAGINYYPSSSPWSRFWPEYNGDVAEGDLDLLAGLGANAVRIFLQRDVFLDPDRSGQALAALDHFLWAASQRDLKVIPTLFDMRPGYATATWADDMRYLETVLPALAGSPAVVAIDLKNEPDLDFEDHGRSAVIAWTRTMAELTRLILPQVPLTVGWSTPDEALTLAGQLDVLSYHDYGPVADTAGNLANVQDAANGTPVMITEIGASSWSLFGNWPGSPDAQASQLASRLSALGPSDGVFVWSLRDFDSVDPNAIGGTFFARQQQRFFGLFDAGGAEKPAAIVVREAFLAD